jgi:hypothetical protein
MASFALALPILPGKTEEWRRFIVEVTGPRRSETLESLYGLDFNQPSPGTPPRQLFEWQAR